MLNWDLLHVCKITFWSVELHHLFQPHFVKPVADLLLQPFGFVLFGCGCCSSNIFGGRPGTHCGSSLDCCANTMPLPFYFTGSFAFLPLPLNLLIFCPVLFPLLPPLIGPCVATCHIEHGSYNCSFPVQDLLSIFASK